MLYVIRQCSACGGSIDIVDGEYLAISTDHNTNYYCKHCLFSNPTFRHIAGQYMLEKANELFQEEKK